MRDNLKKIDEITITKFVSKQDTLNELKERFGKNGSALDGVDTDIFSVSFIVKYDIVKFIDNEEEYQEIIEK